MDDAIREAQKRAISNSLDVKTYKVKPKDADECDADMLTISNHIFFKIVGTEIMIPIENVSHFELKTKS